MRKDLDPDLIKAFIIDFVGLVLFATTMSTVENPILSLGRQQLALLSILFPFAAYMATYKLYSDYFWKAFLSSVAFGFVLFWVVFFGFLSGV